MAKEELIKSFFPSLLKKKRSQVALEMSAIYELIHYYSPAAKACDEFLTTSVDMFTKAGYTSDYDVPEFPIDIEWVKKEEKRFNDGGLTYQDLPDTFTRVNEMWFKNFAKEDSKSMLYDCAALKAGLIGFPDVIRKYKETYAGKEDHDLDAYLSDKTDTTLN